MLLLLNSEETIEKLSGCNIHEIGVSLYSAKKDVHELITQGVSFDNTIASIEKLQQHNLFVRINCVILKQNYVYCKDLIDYANKVGCGINFDISITPRLNSDITPIQLALGHEEYVQFFMDNSTPHYIGNIAKIEINPEDSPCNAGRYSLCVDSKGDIYPCVSLRMKLGNVDDSLTKVWNGNIKLIKFKNKYFEEFGRHSYCQYCTEFCAGIAQLENGNYLHCPQSICKRAQAREKAFQNFTNH